MPINQNHTFEDLTGVKCAIVEKNARSERVAFLKDLLEYNGFTVMVAPSPPPKAAPAAVVSATTPEREPEPIKETFTVGVTNVMFNATNAIFGRLLKTRDGHVVTLAYWEQRENESSDEIPYYERDL